MLMVPISAILTLLDAGVELEWVLHSLFCLNLRKGKTCISLTSLPEDHHVNFYSVSYRYFDPALIPSLSLLTMHAMLFAEFLEDPNADSLVRNTCTLGTDRPQSIDFAYNSFAFMLRITHKLNFCFISIAQAVSWAQKTACLSVQEVKRTVHQKV